MENAMEKRTSSLAMVEKKPQRTGGCVGIFFQLFEWNRRISKKKLFSKKLLPPVRSKKNGGDEKHSKLRRIADENSGGFPNMKKNRGSNGVDLERKREVRTPGLVARLMGLESMPVLQRQKSKMAQVSRCGSCKPEKVVDNECEHEVEELNAEKGGSKHEPRPQKLQKTSSNERLTITPFEAETQTFKNVLLRSKKHHPKLPSPVKSPRNLSKKNASKLIGAATRILEPGLQTSKSKSSLTYFNTSHHPPEHESLLDKSANMSSNQLEDSATFSSIVLNGHQSCPSCGHCMGKLGSKTCDGEQPFMFTLPSSHSRQGSEKTKLGEPAFYQEKQDELPEDYRLTVAPFMDSERPSVKHNSEKSSFSGQVCGSWMDRPLSFGSNQRTGSQNQVSRRRDSAPARSKLTSLSRDKISMSNSMNETMNFVSLNQSRSGLSRSLSHVAINNGKSETERGFENRHHDLELQGRKRRPANISRQGESCSVLNSNVHKQTYGFTRSSSGNKIGSSVHYDNRRRRRSGSLGLQETRVGSGKGDHTGLSFQFNSSTKQKPAFSTVTKRRAQNDSDHDGVSPGSNEDDGMTRFEKLLPHSGDALGLLLEQKLKELACQGDYAGGSGAKKTTAMILQELITALTSEIPFHGDKSSVISDKKTSFHCHLSCSKSSASYQANSVKDGENERLSPGSVLETYSSDMSCLSSSQGDTSENLDSLASENTAKTSRQPVGNIINNVSEIFRCLNLANCGLRGIKLDHANDVILHAELSMGSAAHTGSVAQSFSLKHLLVEELETLATILWMNFGCSLGVEDSKEANELRTFALDSGIEYLESRFSTYLESGTALSRRSPLCLNTNTVIFDIVEEVRKWEESSRFLFDDLIEREMSRSVGEWTRFKTERFETAVEISRHLLQNLVEEIVIDS